MALIVFRRYLVFSAAAHLAWELLHLPLYAQWQAGTPLHSAFFLVRCIGSDVAIAVSALVIGAVAASDAGWPRRAYAPAGGLTIAIGLAAAVFAERYHVGIAQTWSYSSLMPLVPYLEAGLSPLAQWLILPLAGLWWARRGLKHGGAERRILPDRA